MTGRRVVELRDRDSLVGLVEDGWTQHRIAERFGCSERSVRYAMRRHGIDDLRLAEPSDLDEATLRRLYLVERQPIRDIAAAHNIGYKSVFVLRKKYGIPNRPLSRARPSKYTELADREWLTERLSEGMNISQLARLVGCDRNAIRAAIRRLKVSSLG